MTLQRTALHALHLELGARMVPFAGYEMPVQYPDGVLQEHHHTRTAAGLFDVSHMGQVRLRGADAGAALETLMPVDVVDLPAGMQRYAVFTNDEGGILDDLMVARLDGELLVVVNAACKEQDIAHMRRELSHRCEVEPLHDRALLALQGPQAVEALATLAPEVQQMRFMDIRRVSLLGVSCVVSRSGYTGEDGFEISVPAPQAEALARALLAHPAVRPIGLGARDSLRLEAGLCLYGHDMDPTTSPVEASLSWALSKSRRAGGARSFGYPGAAVIARHLADGVQRKRIGLRGLDRVPVREGAALFSDETSTLPVGRVTSGGPGPTAGAPVAMGYVVSEWASPDTKLFAEVRGRRVPMQVARTPFVPQRYWRG